MTLGRSRGTSTVIFCKCMTHGRVPGHGCKNIFHMYDARVPGHGRNNIFQMYDMQARGRRHEDIGRMCDVPATQGAQAQ